MIRAGGNDEDVVCFEEDFLAINDGFTLPYLEAEELVDRVVDLHTDVFAREKTHQNELAMGTSEENLAEVIIVNGKGFNIAVVGFHGFMIHYLGRW